MFMSSCSYRVVIRMSIVKTVLDNEMYRQAAASKTSQIEISGADIATTLETFALNRLGPVLSGDCIGVLFYRRSKHERSNSWTKATDQPRDATILFTQVGVQRDVTRILFRKADHRFKGFNRLRPVAARSPVCLCYR